MGHAEKSFQPANIAVLTVSDTRTEDNDTSGSYLVESATEAGHTIIDKQIVIDDKYKIRAIVSQWIADPKVQVVMVTGELGLRHETVLQKFLIPLFDKQVEGFGELFRHVSYQEIGTSTIQSRAVGGFANHTVIFALPGSTGACRTGWTKIIEPQLDATHRPCNFMPHIGG